MDLDGTPVVGKVRKMKYYPTIQIKNDRGRHDPNSCLLVTGQMCKPLHYAAHAARLMNFFISLCSTDKEVVTFPVSLIGSAVSKIFVDDLL